jgi:hypothetical protein
MIFLLYLKPEMKAIFPEEIGIDRDKNRSFQVVGAGFINQQNTYKGGQNGRQRIQNY